MGGVRESEDWTIRVDAGEYDPVLGDSYQAFARLGSAVTLVDQAGQVLPQEDADAAAIVARQLACDGVAGATDRTGSASRGLAEHEPAAPERPGDPGRALHLRRRVARRVVQRLYADRG